MNRCGAERSAEVWSISTLKVGVVGGGAGARWGARVHLPVLASLPEFEITAVCTAHEESAAEAAQRFGVPHTFTDYRQLVAHPDVDLVAIAVRGSLHHPVALAALDAGKHVFCEWPLAMDLNQAMEMQGLALKNGLHHCLGLQARTSPEVMYLKELVDGGYIGKPLTFASSFLNGTALRGRDSSMMYLLKEEGGGSDLLIGMGHTLDVLQYVLGDIATLSGKAATLVRREVLTDTGEEVDVTSADNVALVAELRNGAMGVIQSSRTVSPGEGWRLIVSGTEGKLVASSPRAPQMLPIRITGTRKGSSSPDTLDPPERFSWVSEVSRDSEGFNTAQLMRRLGRAIGEGVEVTPNFEDGVRLHGVLEAISASRDGWVSLD